MLKKRRIHVENFGEILTDPGHLFLEVLNSHGLDLHNDCGGQGKCGKCRIVFHSTPPDCVPKDITFLKAGLCERGYRLACYHQVTEDCRIEIPPVVEHELLDDLSEDEAAAF